MNTVRDKMGGLAALAVVIFLTAASAGTPFFGVPASAQTASKFSSVVVRGNQRIETSTIKNFASLNTGKPISPGQINAAYQRLDATGLFEEVTITPSGGSLIITVQEFPTINRINFERNKRLKDELLADLITSQPRQVYSPAQAEADAAIVVEAYRQAGRYSAEVTPKIIRRTDNRVDIVFEVFEGKVIEIQRLSFIGNRFFSDRRLRSVLLTKQAGIFRNLIKSDTFVVDRVEFDKQVLRDFYLSRGFVDFEVLSVSTEVVRERNGFFLTFTVREGQSYSFGELTTTSDLAEIDPDDYHATILVKHGHTVSPVAVEKIVARMERLATKRGLSFIRVTPRVTRNDKDRTIDIEFVVEKGPRIFVERIDIEGNVTTMDQVIRRQFKTVEGDPFNPREIRAAAARIQALGFFAVADVTTREGSSPDRVIVDVDVEDKPTGSLGFGVTYGASTGIGGVINLSESNFLGRGQFLRVNIGAGTSTSDYELTFAEPAFLGRKLRFEISGFQKNTTLSNAAYSTTIAGIKPSLSFPVSENGLLSVNYQFANNQVTGVTTEIQDGSGTATTEGSSVLISNGANSVGSIGFTYTFDNRSSGLNPKAGTVLKVTQELAGVGGSTSYSRTSAMIGARTTLFREEVSLSVELEGGALTSFSGSSNLLDRFFMGSSIMRGYQNKGIGPRDLGVTNMDALGGNFYAVARLEANFPLGLPQEYGLSGGIFLDVGSLWGLDDTAGGATGGASTVDASMILRSVIGVSLFWETAVGPLRFNWSQVLSGASYDETESFELTIGKRF